MPKFNAYPSTVQLNNTDIMLADTQQATNTRKIAYSDLRTQLQNESKSVFALKGEVATDEQVADAVGDWLEEHVTPTMPTVLVDDTLSIEDAAAEAKATGDAIDEVSNSVDDLKTYLNIVNPSAVLTWEVGKNVNGNGNVATDSSKALSNVIPCTPGDIYFRGTPSKDANDNTLYVYINEYSGSTWIRRTATSLVNATITTGETTDNIRIGFGRAAAAGALSAEDITIYFKDVFYRRSAPKVEFDTIKNKSFLVHGDITALGYTKLSDCTEPGIYTFSTAQIASITDMPSYIKTGGMYIVRSSVRPYSELLSTNYHYIRYAQGTWTDIYSYIRLSYESDAGADDSTERINIDIPNSHVLGSYFRYKMGHCINANINANVWRLIGIFDFRILGTNVDPTETALTTRGEFECALHLADRDDFSGGIVHGDEVDNDMTMIIDGVKTVIGGIPSNPYCREIRIIRNSNLYDPADHATVIAKHSLEYLFNSDGLTIKQAVKWQGNYNVTNCYLAMFPFKKAYSTYRYDDTDFSIVTNDQTSYGVWIPGAKSVTEFSTNYLGEMSISRYPEGLSGGDRARVTDNSGLDYNKVYFVICTSGSIETGTLWQSETHYKMR